MRTFRVLHKDVMNGMFEDPPYAQWGEPERQLSPNMSWAANQCFPLHLTHLPAPSFSGPPHALGALFILSLQRQVAEVGCALRSGRGGVEPKVPACGLCPHAGNQKFWNLPLCYITDGLCDQEPVVCLLSSFH